MARGTARQIVEILGRPKPPEGLTLAEWDATVDRVLRVYRNLLDAKTLLQTEIADFRDKFGDDFVDDVFYSSFPEPTVSQVYQIDFYSSNYMADVKVYADLWSTLYKGSGCD